MPVYYRWLFMFSLSLYATTSCFWGMVHAYNRVGDIQIMSNQHNTANKVHKKLRTEKKKK